MNIINRLLTHVGLRNRKFGMAEVAFYKKAAHFGEHGRAVVSCPRLNLVEEEVSFCFMGMKTPPNLSLHTVHYLTEEAEEQGYILHHITAYGTAVIASHDSVRRAHNNAIMLAVKQRLDKQFQATENMLKPERELVEVMARGERDVLSIATNISRHQKVGS